jgi:hypothetical protein
MATAVEEKLYKTSKTLKRTLRVDYPPGQGKIVLRTELDWTKDVEAISVSDDGSEWTFELRRSSRSSTSSPY